MLKGAPGATEIGDRRAAIARGGRAMAGPEDIVLIAGKGHEQGQIVGDLVLPFDDVHRRAGVRGVRTLIVIPVEGERIERPVSRRRRSAIPRRSRDAGMTVTAQ